MGLLLEPYARQKLKARIGGKKGRHLWPRLVQKLESRSVKKKLKKIVGGGGEMQVLMCEHVASFYPGWRGEHVRGEHVTPLVSWLGGSSQ